jgi:hypothetical protein
MPLPRPASLTMPPARGCSTIDPSTSADAPQSPKRTIGRVVIYAAASAGSMAPTSPKEEPERGRKLQFRTARSGASLLGGAASAHGGVAHRACEQRAVHWFQVL